VGISENNQKISVNFSKKFVAPQPLPLPTKIADWGGEGPEAREFSGE
jgi:hypothetical protein